MRWILGLFILGISTAFCFKKEPATIHFSPKFGKEILVPGKNFFLPAINDSVNVDVFRFYVSDIYLFKENKIIFRMMGSYLLDLDNKLDIPIEMRIPDFDKIQFCLGVDSITNSGGVKGGDLDPTKNMYWAWQSGYINFKLEGKSKACKTRNNVFQYHIGGYSHPFNALQTITIPVKNPGDVQINFDLEKFLSGVGLQTTNEIMSPGEKAMQVARLYKTVFEAQ